MDSETAKKSFDALTGEGWYWDCRVLTKDGVFKANDIQLAKFPQIEKSLTKVEIVRKSDDQHVWDLDLTKYSHKAVLEFLRFVYLSETANLTTQNDQRYLAEEVWSLAVEFEISELQAQCVKALSSDSIPIDEGNFVRLAQLGGEMNSKSLVRKCLVIFQQKLAINAEHALREVREGAPMFLNSVIMDVQYRPPASVTPASSQDAGEGFAIDPHDCDDELFEEVLSSDSYDETKRHLTSDFEIRCSDAPDRPIRCHRSVLLRVPYFKQMLQHDFEETRKKFVEVEKEREVVIETLRYVYTGKNTDLPHTMKDQETFLAESVIDLAQQYELYVLKHGCHEAMLECDISHSNVLRLLGIAVLYELNELKFKCLRYFFDNRKVLLNTDQWQNADVAIVRTVVEAVLTLPTVIERFCVYDESVWTVEGNGCESSKIAVGGSDMWKPLVQLDNRTVMIFTTGRQAKLFDVIDHSLTDCSPMQFVHKVSSANVFNGDVYVTGGADHGREWNRCSANVFNGDVYVTGGADHGREWNRCERYNRATDGDVYVTGGADHGREWNRCSANVFNGDVYVTGGADHGREWNRCERYNRATDGDVYVTGGADHGREWNRCERYNRATDTWERVADMNRGKWRHAMVVWEGSLLAIGGDGSGGSIERYDAVADRWEVIRENEGILMRGWVRAAVINSELWVRVMRDGSYRVWKVDLDLDADEWVEIPAPDALVHCMFEREGKAHLIGSKSDSGPTCLFAFDEDTGGWKEVFEISKSNVHAIPIVTGEM